MQAWPVSPNRTKYRAVDGPVDIGVGADDHGVLAPEFQAVGDQALRGRGGDAAPGVDRSGEHDVVDDANQGGTGFPKTIDDVEHGRGADLLPAVDRGLPRQRRELRRLGQHRAPGHQRRRDIQQRPRQRAIPGRDDPDELVWLIDDGQLFRGVRDSRRAHRLVGQEFGGVVDPVVGDLCPQQQLSRRISPGLAAFELHQGAQFVGVVKQPVAPFAQPPGAPLDVQPLPCRLRLPQPGRNRLHLRGGCHRHLADHLTGGGALDHDVGADIACCRLHSPTLLRVLAASQTPGVPSVLSAVTHGIRRLRVFQSRTGRLVARRRTAGRPAFEPPVTAPKSLFYVVRQVLYRLRRDPGEIHDNHCTAEYPDLNVDADHHMHQGETASGPRPSAEGCTALAAGCERSAGDPRSCVRRARPCRLGRHRAC